MIEYKKALVRCIKEKYTDKSLEFEFFKTVFNLESSVWWFYGEGDNVIRQLQTSGLEQVKHKQHVRESNDIVEEYTFKYLDYNILFIRKPNKGRPVFSILLTLPNQKVYNITRKSNYDGIMSYIYSLEKWDVYTTEWKKAQEFINKTRKQLEIGKNTIFMMLENILHENKWEYELSTENYEMTLRIKMRYHRCIEIKLTPSMDMVKLTQITEMVKTVTNAMNAVGNINLTVKNYGSDVKWKSTKGNVDADE